MNAPALLALILLITPALAAADAPPAGPSVKGLAWLGGSWTSQQTNGGVAEQAWLRPDAGSMLGVFRLVRKGKVEFTELLTVREEDYGLVLTIRRLGPNMQPLPGDKGGLAEFVSTRQTPTGTVFESKDAKLERITWRTSSGGMEVQVIPRGSSRPVLFGYTRVTP
jgi:hypothetical protein